MSSRKLFGQRKIWTLSLSLSGPVLVTRYAIGFGPDGGTSRNSPTVPLSVVSVARSYLGGACANAEVVMIATTANCRRRIDAGTEGIIADPPVRGNGRTDRLEKQ